MYPKPKPNVGKYSIHGAFGVCEVSLRKEIVAMNYFVLRTEDIDDAPESSPQTSHLPKRKVVFQPLFFKG